MPSAIKPRLELRRVADVWKWEWWGRSRLPGCPYIFIGAARYLTVADALAIYRSAW